MNKKLLRCTLFIVFPLAGCIEPGPPTPISAIVPDGWNCLAAPSAFDGPGSIFRVTEDGTKFTVGDFGSDVPRQSGPFVAPTVTQTRDIGAGVVAQLIGLPMSANAAAADKYRVQQKFGGVQELNTTDDAVRNVVNAFYTRPDLDRNQRYYLVRRAVTATSVRYDFDQDISGSFGADIAAKVVTVRPKASYSRADGIHYDNTFSQPVNVCVLAQQLPVPQPPAQAPAAPGIAIPDNVPLFNRIGNRPQ